MIERNIISLFGKTLEGDPKTCTITSITGPELNQTFIPAQLIQAMLGLVSVRGLALEVPRVEAQTFIADDVLRVESFVVVQPPIGNEIYINCLAHVGNDGSDLGLGITDIHAERDTRQRLGTTQRLALAGVNFNQLAKSAAEHFPTCLDRIIHLKLRTLGIVPQYSIRGEIDQDTLSLTLTRKP